MTVPFTVLFFAADVVLPVFGFVSLVLFLVSSVFSISNLVNIIVYIFHVPVIIAVTHMGTDTPVSAYATQGISPPCAP